MQRAIELALLGAGSVAPNPMVGCVIVKDNQIIGEGWHRNFGGPHAEINALNQVSDKSLLNGAEVFVTLEPCSHTGKTPPCADALIQYAFRKVYIATLDPNPQVAGKGMARLQQAGIKVEVGLLEEESREMNRRFLCFHEKKRPYILLKWAQTSDGFIAKENYDSKWISNELSRMLVHKWRSEEAAIMVGTNTAWYDNPSLTVRSWSGKSPIRILLDRSLRIPASHHLHDGSETTLVYHDAKVPSLPSPAQFVPISFEGDVLKTLLEDWYQKNILSVLVEGGTALLQSFIDQDLWDESRIFTSKQVFEKGILAPQWRAAIHASDKIGEDELKILRKG